MIDIHRDTRSSGSLLSIGILLLLAALFVFHALHYAFLMDDAYISFRYAANLVDGHGLVYNPGERVEGYSNLLWVLLMALGLRVGVSPELLSQSIGVLSSLLVLGGVWILARRWMRGTPGAAYLAAIPVLLLIGNRSFAAWATSGLETRFFTALIVATLVALDVEWDRGDRAFPWSAIPLGLMVATRVDGFLPAGLIVAGVWLFSRGRGGRRGFILLATVAGVVLLQTLFRVVYYDDFLPNTYRVKVVGLALVQGLRYVGRALLSYGIVPGLVLGGVAAWKLRRPSCALALALVVMQIAYVTVVGGDHFEFRLLDPIWPGLFLTAVVGTVLAMRGLGRTVSRSAAALLAVTAVWSFVPNHTGFANTYETVSVEAEALFCTRWTEIGRWFREHADGTEVIALRPAGVIPYMSGLRALDMHGLNDRIVARRPPNPDATAAGHRKFAKWQDVLLRAETDYLIDEPRISGDRQETRPPRVISVKDRRFALLQKRVQLSNFWFEFFIVSRDPTSPPDTRIQPDPPAVKR